MTETRKLYEAGLLKNVAQFNMGTDKNSPWMCRNIYMTQIDKLISYVKPKTTRLGKNVEGGCVFGILINFKLKIINQTIKQVSKENKLCKLDVI